MVVAAMQGANQHIRSTLGFSISPKDTLTWGIEPVTFKTLALSLFYSYSAVLSSFPRQLNKHSHLCSPSPTTSHEGRLGQ